MEAIGRMFKNTTWHNPTTHTVKFDIFVSPGNIYHNEVKPDDTIEVPTVYDNAIQTIRDGVIVGGKAPQLVAKGRKEVPMHDALARAAAQGDVEREMLRQTGTTAGSLSFDMGAQLMKQVSEAKAEADQMKTANEALMVRLAALESAQAPKETPPKVVETKAAPEDREAETKPEPKKTVVPDQQKDPKVR